MSTPASHLSMTRGSSNHHTLPSLELVLDLTREQLNNQRDRMKALDTKANVVLGSASLVTGLTAFQTTVKLPLVLGGGLAILDANASIIVGILTVIAVAAFWVVVFMAYLGFRIRTLETAPDPVALRTFYLKQPITKTQEDTLNEMVESFENTEKVIGRKAKWVQRSLVALSVEAILLTLLILARALL